MPSAQHFDIDPEQFWRDPYHQAERKVYFPAVSPKLVREYWATVFEAHTARTLDGLAASGSA